MNKNEIEKILKENSTPQKEAWARNIINTKMPMYVVKTKVLQDIAKQILKGNYIEYLDNETFDYYENTIIYVKVLSKIKDFELFKKYLYKYIPFIDCWASCDGLCLKIKLNEYEKYLELSKQLIVDKRTYARRLGVLMWFKMLDSNEYTKTIFDLIKSTLKDEKEYYVNMCISWFLCDAFIKQREMTIQFLNNENVSDFVLNKTISKCCDSFRVSNEDKLYLKQLKCRHLIFANY